MLFLFTIRNIFKKIKKKKKCNKKKECESLSAMIESTRS